jgi:hypothetical protein
LTDFLADVAVEATESELVFLRDRPVVFLSTVCVVGLMTSTSIGTSDLSSLLSSTPIMVSSSPLVIVCCFCLGTPAASGISGEASGIVAATDLRAIWRVDIRGGDTETDLGWPSETVVSSATSDASCPEAPPICSDLRGLPIIPPREPRGRLLCPFCAIGSLLRLFLRRTPGGSLSKLEGTASASAARMENGI